MSKRFGRNQKRALLAQLNDAQALARTQQRLKLDTIARLKQARERVNELEDVIQFTREVIGKFFVTLPVQTVPLEKGRDTYQVPHNCAAHRLDVSKMGDCAALASEVLRFEELEALRVDIPERFADLRGMMHLRFKNSAGQMAYGFNTNSFRGFPRQRVAHIIAESMYRYLMENPAVLDRLGVRDDR